MHERFVQYDLGQIMFQEKKSIPEPHLRGLIVSTYSSSSFTFCFKMHFLFLPLQISVMLRSKF